MNIPQCESNSGDSRHGSSSYEELLQIFSATEITPEYGRTSRAYSASMVPPFESQQNTNHKLYPQTNQIYGSQPHKIEYRETPYFRDIPRSLTSEIIPNHYPNYHKADDNSYYYNQNYNLYIPPSSSSYHDYLSDHSIDSYDSMSDFKSRTSSSSIHYIPSYFQPIQEIYEEDNSFNFNAHHLLKQCYQQQGCRKIQNALERNEISVHYIISVIEPHYLSIMKDQFGNYLFQKVVQLMDPYQYITMYQQVSQFFSQLLTDKHGTRSVQAIIKNCKDKKVYNDILSIITPYIYTLCCNSHSYHCINLLITTLPDSLRSILISTILKNFSVLCKDVYGCNVMQRCYEYSNVTEKNNIIKLLLDNIDIVSDEHANYFVQYVITYGDKNNGSHPNGHNNGHNSGHNNGHSNQHPGHNYYVSNSEVVNKIYNKISSNIIDLSLHKASSNVVEKCVEYGNDTIKLSIIDKFIKSDNILKLIEHEFSNYVIQSLLKHSSPQVKESLVKVIEHHKSQLMKSKIGKKVLALQ